MAAVIGELCEVVATATPETTCGEIFTRLWDDPNLDCVPVLEGGRPIGLVHREEFLLTYAAPFRADLYARRSITLMMDSAPLMVADGLPIDAVAALIVERPRTQFRRAFIITCAGVFLGICTPVALLRASMMIQMQRASELSRERERAEAQSKSKTHFLASTSHELRTPLNAIIGFADVIRSEVFGPVSPAKYVDYINDIHMSGQHLLGLINDILDVARIEGGHLSLYETRFSLSALVWEIDRLMRGLASKGGLDFTIDVPATLPPLTADQQRLRQVLVNLVSNAIKFTPAGGAVRLSARLVAEGYAIAVSDTGIGMSADDAARVINPFEQVETWENRTKAGTGLGLAIVKGMTEAHEGTLRIDSALGQGTTVTITLPWSRVHHGDGVQAAPALQAAS